MFGKLLVACSLASLAAAPAPLPYVVSAGDQTVVAAPAPVDDTGTQPAVAPTPAVPVTAATPATPVTPAVAPVAQTTPAPATPRTPRAPAAPRTPETAPPPAVAPTPPPPPRALGQLANVIVDVVINDRGPDGPENKRVISATAADGERASVRNSARVVMNDKGGYTNTGLSLDIRPVLADNNRVRLEVGLEFELLDATRGAGDQADKSWAAFGSVRLTQNVVLESGKPLIISQSTAPGTQRTVTVEVKATVLK